MIADDRLMARCALIAFAVLASCADEPVPVPDSDASSDVEVDGPVTDPRCPLGIVSTSEPVVDPGTVIGVAPLPSFEAVEYSWSLTQPVGSLAMIEAATQTSVVADVVGSYTIALNARVAGVVCPRVERVFDVVPSGRIYIELLWHTPADPDEANEGAVAGTDLDLHFTDPRAVGPWFDSTYDAYWFNESPRWFDRDLGPNPLLVRDDTDGGGPEAIDVEWLDNDACYQVGVHFWEDNDFGPADATVRIFVDAELMFESTAELRKNDLWHVTEICVPVLAPFVLLHDDCAGPEPCSPRIVHDYIPPLTHN